MKNLILDYSLRLTKVFLVSLFGFGGLFLSFYVPIKIITHRLVSDNLGLNIIAGYACCAIILCIQAWLIVGKLFPIITNWGLQKKITT